MTHDDRLSQMRHAVERDAARVGKPHDHGSLLRAMGLIGSVGWPIALLTGGGAVLGHWIDRRLGGGVSATLTLLTLGAVVGSALAARSLRAREGS
jgi:ATP synthase protein I